MIKAIDLSTINTVHYSGWTGDYWLLNKEAQHLYDLLELQNADLGISYESNNRCELLLWHLVNRLVRHWDYDDGNTGGGAVTWTRPKGVQS